MKKQTFVMVILSLLSVLLVTSLLAQDAVKCESDYTVQAGDSLRKIAEKHYDDREAYKAIVDATNATAATDGSYTRIESPSIIQPGWKLCLPEVRGTTPQPSEEQKATEGLLILLMDALKNMEYKSEWTESGKAKLTNGEYREPAAPGSTSETAVTLTDNVAFGQLNGQDAAAVVLVTNTGGTGNFTDLAIVINQDGKPVNVAAAPLGDRVRINSLTIENNEIAVDMITHGPDDPMCCPTQQVVWKYALEGDQLKQTSQEVRGTVESGEEAKTEPKSAGTNAGLTSENISFDDQGLANEVKGISMEALPYDTSQPPGPTGWPEHVVFLFDGAERLRIYSVKAYEDLWNAAGNPTISNNITQLRTVLSKRPGLPQNPLPFLPPIYAYNDLAAQIGFLDFANGSGLGYVGRFSQDASPVLNRQLKYIFQGLTHDNKYYVSFEYPVSTAALPDDVENMTAEQQKQATDDFQSYLRATQDKLNDLAPVDFTPDLSKLDALVQSITIFEPAMTESQGAGITGVIWKLQEIQEMDNSTIVIDDPAKYTLELQPDGKAAVRADCNFGNGTYTTNGNQLSIEINTLTMTMCPPDSLSDQYINILNETNSYVLEGGNLFISYGIDSGIMKFAR